MHNQSGNFDNLAEYYHLIFENWDDIIHRDSENLARLLAKYFGDSNKVIHDMTCGIGTQTIGLLQRGYQCSGSDLSMKSVIRAKKEIQSRGLHCHLFQADMRHLPELEPSPDVIISYANSITFLPSKDDIIECLSNCYKQVKQGILLTIRDTTKMDKTKVFHPYGKRVVQGKTYFVFQHRVFEDNACTFELFVVEDSDNTPSVKKFVNKFYLHTVEDILNCCVEAGFSDVNVVESISLIKSDYNEPVIVAMKNG
jgi:2-polyprenyl-3-methyl-5-hydroxy-6-metoxy-1,4-benzoquinol methylase